MKHKVICLSFGILAACQTPATRTQTVEVKVPVAVHPIKSEQVPIVPAPLGPRPASPSAAADILLADHCKWVAYGLLTAVAAQTFSSPEQSDR
jgi:hypothetical protein